MVELKRLALLHRYSLDFAGLMKCPYMCPWEVIFHRRMSSLTTGMLPRIVHAWSVLNQSLSSTGLYSSNFFNNPLSPFPIFTGWKQRFQWHLPLHCRENRRSTMIEIAPNLPNAMFSLGTLLHCMHLSLWMVSFHECILYTPRTCIFNE